MSSDLKDARWHLASEMAKDDGIDFYDADYRKKTAYLDIAQGRLNSADAEFITRLAADFRKEQKRWLTTNTTRTCPTWW